MSEQNKRVVLQYVEAFNQGDLDAVCSTFGPEAQIYGVLGWGDVAKARAIWSDLIRCFQMKLQVESIIAERDVVAIRYTERGISTESFRGGQVTFKRYEVTAMEWFEIREGKIHRRWGARDAVAIFKQMGLPLP